MADKLSSTQQALLTKFDQHSRIIRYQGGFWSAPGLPVNHNGAPEWWFGTMTVDALVKRGLLKVVEERANRQGFFAVAVERV